MNNEKFREKTKQLERHGINQKHTNYGWYLN